MKKSEVLDLFIKERDYQTSVFGNYQNNPTLNLASFITFLKIYLSKVEKSYTGVWTSADEFPKWLKGTVESDIGATSPVNSYENLIKLMALAGAALEAYVEVDINEWRNNPTIDGKKWLHNNRKGDME